MQKSIWEWEGLTLTKSPDFPGEFEARGKDIAWRIARLEVVSPIAVSV